MSVKREIALGVGAVVLFGGAVATALTWSRETAMFPLVIGIAGLGLSLWAVINDIVRSRTGADESTPLSPQDKTRARTSFAWIGAFFAAVLLIGFQWGLSLAALAYYRIEAKTGWTAALCAAAICGGFLYGAEHVLHIALFGGLLAALIP